MEFARGHATAAADEDGNRFPEPLPHGDAMLVIRDALLSQLQKDRLRQEIIVAELAKIERDMALRSASASHTGMATADAKPAKPMSFAEVVALRPALATADAERWSRPAMEDRVVECPRTCTGKEEAGQENAASDACKLQEPNEVKVPTKASPSVKWSCAICQVEVTSEGNLLQHFAGQKHRSNAVALLAKARAEKSRKARQFAKQPRPTWVCRFCQANCTSKSDLDKHLKGKKHQEKIQALLEQSWSMEINSASPEADSEPNVVPQEDEEKQGSVWFCGICQVRCPCQAAMDSHLRGKKHQTNVHALQLEVKRVESVPPKIAENQQAPSDFGCGICQAKCNSESQFQNHCRGREHQQKIEALQRGKSAKSSGFETANKPPSDSSIKGARSDEMEMQRMLYFCKLCNLQCNSKNTLVEHRQGKKHLEKVRRYGGY